ncbi:MAG: type B 50S ribosomal protein L31 [Ignavibacteriales bacterium]
MKKGIHPSNYRPVVFQDISVDHSFLVRSSVQTNETIVWSDGNTYPLVKLELSDKSHPFFTGKQKIVDSTGRVERFNKKYGLKKNAQ